jgi:outer membrane protein insertion porin family
MGKVSIVFRKLLITATFAIGGFLASAAEIGKVTFDQIGDYKFSNDMLLYNVQQKTGKEYNPVSLNNDIKRLYGMGYFSDVISETKVLPDGKVAIIIKLKIKPKVTTVKFEGNQKFSSKELKKDVSVAVDMPLNDNDLRESANKLRFFYKSKGYNDAEVSPILKKDGKGIAVIFNIKENLRLKVDNVTFKGAAVYSAWTLKNSIANRHSYLSRFFDFGLLQRNEIDKDKARLRELYWNKGYLDFKVENVTINQEKEDPEYVNINFDLYEGKPYKIGNVTISGNKIFKADELMRLILVKKGEVFDYQKVQASREDIKDMYESLGYTDVVCQAARKPNFKTHIVDLNFAIMEGRKYTVQDVIISGNRITKDYVIRRELVIQPGDPLDKNRVNASKSRLMGMGYFKKVEAVTVNADQVGKKNVQFEVDEKQPFKLKVGGGFSDVNSLVGMVEISNNNFDITDPSNYFMGGGQRFRIRGLVGIERNSLNIDFTEPWLFGIPLRLDVSGYMNEAAYEYWNTTRIGGKFALSKKILDDFTSATFGYKFERVIVDDISRSRSAEMQALATRQWVSQLSLMLNRDTRDSLLEPTSGYQLSALTAVSPRVLGSSNNFYRLESKASYYFSMLDKALIFHAGAKVGTVSDFNRSNPVPVFERYFLGGGDSLRGFPYRSVAPTDINDDPVGGQSMLLGTVEMTHPIWKFIRGAVFADAGNVWWQSYSFGISQMNIGVGYGLRIKVPYLNAPVKLDLAYPVISNQDGLDKKLRFHFNMGFTW